MKSFIRKLMSGKGAAINKQKTNVPKTELQKKTRDLKIAIQKSKAGKAKLDQTIFELKQNKDFTFAPKGKTIKESDRKKQIIKDNSKVIGRMFKKALKGDK